MPLQRLADARGDPGPELGLPAEFRGVFSQHGITLPDENWQLQEFVNAFNRTLAAHDKDVELAVYRRF